MKSESTKFIILNYYKINIKLELQEHLYMKLSVKNDIAIILIISFISAILYITLEGKITDLKRRMQSFQLLVV